MSSNAVATKSHHQFHPSILRAYDIRGVVRETLSTDDAFAIGQGYATICAERTGKDIPTVTVGYDGRLSSPDMKEALIAGLVNAGANVIDIGCGPSPMLYFSVHHLATDGGIMVTGSHNPPTHNGFKMMLGKASFFGDDIIELGQRVENGNIRSAEGKSRTESVSDAYVDALLKGFIAENAKPIRMAIDPGNGAGGEIAQIIADKLPGKHTVINGAIDGTFPAHHPDPTVPKNLEQLISLVTQGDYDVGVAFDGDGDRIGAVDAKGRIIWGDQLMMLFARDVLKHHPGSTIIADVKASQTLFDVITEEDGKPLMWKTGHSLIKSKMKETGAQLAGEMSGHIFFADRFYGFDDGIYAAIRLFNYLAHAPNSLTDMVDHFPATYNTAELRIDTTDTRKFEIIDEVKAALKDSSDDVNEVDGVRVTNDKGWWLARCSNTQPAIIVRVEAKSEESLAELKNTVRTILEKSGLSDLPL